MFVLCGGFGTRLKNAAGGAAKPLAPIRGRPFLDYLLRDFQRQGVQEFVLCLHHLPEQFEEFSARYVRENRGVRIRTSLESAPLGTGGGIRFALEQYPCDSFYVANGDSFAGESIARLDAANRPNQIALVQMQDSGRYGRVDLAFDDRVTAFREKGEPVPGWINAGIYSLESAAFLSAAPQGASSMEREILPDLVKRELLFGVRLNAGFIDIGIPEDYALLERDLEKIITD